jgi:putative endonuclease
MRQYYVYMMTNTSCTFYVGVTNNLERRVCEHKQGLIPGFTHKYHVTWLVYYETYRDVRQAIAREKQLKGWRRAKKIALIRSQNPQWSDLAADWFDEGAASTLSRAWKRDASTSLRSAQHDTLSGSVAGRRAHGQHLTEGDT